MAFLTVNMGSIAAGGHGTPGSLSARATPEFAGDRDTGPHPQSGNCRQARTSMGRCPGLAQGPLRPEGRSRRRLSRSRIPQDGRSRHRPGRLTPSDRTKERRIPPGRRAPPDRRVGSRRVSCGAGARERRPCPGTERVLGLHEMTRFQPASTTSLSRRRTCGLEGFRCRHDCAVSRGALPAQRFTAIHGPSQTSRKGEGDGTKRLFTGKKSGSFALARGSASGWT